MDSGLGFAGLGHLDKGFGVKALGSGLTLDPTMCVPVPGVDQWGRS